MVRASPVLLNRASDVGKNLIGVRADQFDSPDDDYENYREHDRVLRNVLPLVVMPKSVKMLHNLSPPDELAYANAWTERPRPPGIKLPQSHSVYGG
jgi:hypothetical protein